MSEVIDAPAEGAAAPAEAPAAENIPSGDLLGGAGVDPAPAPAPAGGGEDPGSWYDSINEKYRDNPNITKYKSMDDFLEGHLNQASLVGKKGLQPLGPDATPEEREAFYSRIGRPESPDAYEWDAPTVEITGEDGEVQQVPMVNLEPELMSETMKVFHENGLNNDQVSKVMNMFAEHEHARHQEGIDQFANEQEQKAMESKTNLMQEWGDKFETKLNAVNNVVNKFGLADTLKDSGLANDYRVIKMFESMIDKVGEGQITGDMSPTGGGFEDTVKAIRSSDAYNNPMDPGHKAAHDKLINLYEKRYN